MPSSTQRAHLAYSTIRTEPVDAAQARLRASSNYLREVMGQVPVLVIGAISAGSADFAEGSQAGLWGSLLPAAWSLALALRARGLGTTWTTLHLKYEREVADLLGIPADVRQGVLFPVAYTKAPTSARGHAPIWTRSCTSTPGEKARPNRSVGSSPRPAVEGSVLQPPPGPEQLQRPAPSARSPSPTAPPAPTPADRSAWPMNPIRITWTT